MARKNNKGWILLHRQLLDSEIWNLEEPFGFRSAWIDLILKANHEDRSLLLKSGKRVIVSRGQEWTSVRTLAGRWRWSKQKVSNYLESLQEMGMITIEKTKSGTLITLVNYRDFQDFRNVSGTRMGQEQDKNGTRVGQETDGTKNYRKNYNNVERKEADAFGVPALED
jgi:hypothetical protein